MYGDPNYKLKLIPSSSFQEILDERLSALQKYRGRAQGRYDSQIEDTISLIIQAHNKAQDFSSRAQNFFSEFDDSLESYYKYLDKIAPKPKIEKLDKTTRNGVEEVNRLTRVFISHIWNNEEAGNLKTSEYVDEYFSHKRDIQRSTLKHNIATQLIFIDTARNSIEAYKLTNMLANIFINLLYAEILLIRGSRLEKRYKKRNIEKALAEAAVFPITGLSSVMTIYHALKKNHQLRENPDEVFSRIESEYNEIESYFLNLQSALLAWTSVIQETFSETFGQMERILGADAL